MIQIRIRNDKKLWIQIHNTEIFASNYLDPDDAKRTKQKVSMEFVFNKALPGDTVDDLLVIHDEVDPVAGEDKELVLPVLNLQLQTKDLLNGPKFNFLVI